MKIVAVQNKPTVLIVDSEVSWQQKVTNLLEDKFDVTVAENYDEAILCISSQALPFHVIVTEISLKEEDEDNLDGFSVIDYLNDSRENVQVIILTRYATPARAVKAVLEKKVFNLVVKVKKEKDDEPYTSDRFLRLVQEAAAIASRNVFLVMPFADEYKGFYNQIFNTVDSLGMNCRRADDIFRPNVVMTSILEEIDKSRIVIADLTGKNPNVYFEVGIAHARKRNVIFLTKNENDISRNLKIMGFITYIDSMQGAVDLKKALVKAIIDVRYKNSPPIATIDDLLDVKQCLVLISDDLESKKIYEHIIEPVLREFQSIQIKDITDSFDLLTATLKILHSSQFLIADVRENDPDFYYLAGYAYGLGKKVVYLAQSEEEIPFDLRNLSSIIYPSHLQNSYVEAKSKLENAINRILSYSTFSANQSTVKVFISYAIEDKPLVRNLFKELKKNSWIEPWLDEENVLPGQVWALETERAMNEADAILVCISEKSVNKVGFIQEEIRKATELQRLRPDGEIFLIPVLLEQCQLPIGLQKYRWATPDRVDLIIKSLEKLGKKNDN